VIFFFPVVGNILQFSLVPGVCRACGGAKGHRKPVAPAAAAIVWERLRRRDASVNARPAFRTKTASLFFLIFNEATLGSGQRGWRRVFVQKCRPRPQCWWGEAGGGPSSCRQDWGSCWWRTWFL